MAFVVSDVGTLKVNLTSVSVVATELITRKGDVRRPKKMVKNRLAILDDGKTGQIKLKLIQDGKPYEIKTFTRDQVRTTSQIVSWIVDVFTELRKYGIETQEANGLFKNFYLPGVSPSPEETILDKGPISSQGQIKIKKTVKPFLPWKKGDQIEFILKDKDVVIRNTHKKA